MYPVKKSNFSSALDTISELLISFETNTAYCKPPLSFLKPSSPQIVSQEMLCNPRPNYSSS